MISFSFFIYITPNNFSAKLAKLDNCFKARIEWQITRKVIPRTHGWWLLLHVIYLHVSKWIKWFQTYANV